MAYKQAIRGKTRKHHRAFRDMEHIASIMGVKVEELTTTLYREGTTAANKAGFRFLSTDTIAGSKGIFWSWKDAKDAYRKYRNR